MMKRIGFLVLLVVALMMSAWAGPIASKSVENQPAQKSLIKLKAGDVIKVVVLGFPEYSLEYPVLSDGTVSGVGFGLIQVANRTIPQVQATIAKNLTRYIKKPQVAVVLTQERVQSIFVVTLNANYNGGNSSSQATTSGAFPYFSELDLRSAIALVGAPFPTEDYRVNIYRNGVNIKELELTDLVAPRNPVWNGPLKPNDVIAITPIYRIRVWLVGLVNKPGEYLVRPNDTLDKVLALSGGLNLGGYDYNEISVFIRRGPDMIEVPLRADSDRPATALMPGDTIIVQPPSTVRVTFSGFINNPGIFNLRKGTSLQSAVGSVTKGLLDSATLTGVIVVRGVEVLSIDASAPTSDSKPFELRDGDSVYVRENLNAYYVLGEVKFPGRYLIEDNRKEVRLSDVLAKSGGTTDAGSLRRVSLLTVIDGKYVDKEYNLDEFLKDGKIESNPIVRPGDVVLFGRPKGFNAGNILQILPSILVLNSYIKK